MTKDTFTYQGKTYLCGPAYAKQQRNELIGGLFLVVVFLVIAFELLDGLRVAGIIS